MYSAFKIKITQVQIKTPTIIAIFEATHSGHSKLLQLLPVASYGYPSVQCRTTEIAGYM